MRGVPDIWSGSGDEVSAVNPDDLRNVWKMTCTILANNQGQGVALDARMFERMCSPGANVMAVWYRASMLGMLQILPGEPLTQWLHDGELDEAVFQVAATFPLKKMEVGVVHEGLPFGVEEFFKQVGART